VPAPKLEILDSRKVRGADGREYDVLEAIAALPWVSQLCPSMPHQYAVLFTSPDWAWYVLDAMVGKHNPDSYQAYFRGYPTPNRYWVAPDGQRYWRTGIMLNRCTLDSVEPPRRVDEGAKRIKDWDGPPFAPNGCGLYVEVHPGKWWPTYEALASGYLPCKACQKQPAPPALAGSQSPHLASTT
jgi:hypothetical protein